MRKLSEYIKRIRSDEKSAASTDVKDCSQKIKLKLPYDISQIIEKYEPRLHLPLELKKNNFFRLTSQAFSTVAIKHIEKCLVYNDRRKFNIELAPFVSLQILKITNCRFFDCAYLKNTTVKKVIFDSVDQIIYRNNRLDMVEFNNMKYETIKTMLSVGFIGNVCLNNVNVGKNCVISKHISILSLKKCGLTQQEALYIVKTHRLIDFSFIEKNFEIECTQNNLIKYKSLRIKHCSEEFYKLNYESIKQLELYDTHFLGHLSIKSLESLILRSTAYDPHKLTKFLMQYKIIALDFENSVVPQTTLCELVAAFKDTLRHLNIRNVEISVDFIASIRKILRRCSVLYGMDQSIMID